MVKDQEVDRGRLEAEFARLEQQAWEDISGEGLEVERFAARRSLDVRYIGQSYELTVDYPAAGRRDLRRALSTDFHKAHRQRFGYADPSEPVEVVNLRMKMVMPVDKPLPEPEERGGEDPGSAWVGEATVVFPEGPVEAPSYLRERLLCGNRVPGPALVLQMDSTTVIPPGWVAEVDRWGNLVVTP